MVLTAFMAMLATLGLMWHMARDGALLRLAREAASHGMYQGPVAALKDILGY